MNRILIGIIFGVIAGIIDVVPMILQKLSWDADISAFSMWVIIGFFISTSTLKINSIMKGLIISILAIIPIAIIIGAKGISTLIPISIMTLFLGSLTGFLIGKFGKK